MRKLLNTLYITTPESYIYKDGDNVVISLNQQEIFRIPIINIEGIVTFGYMGASPGLMKLCADHGVALTFLSPHGHFIGRFQGSVQGNVLLRKRQYQVSEDDSYCLNISRVFIAGKVQNYRNILMRFLRDYGPDKDVEAATIRHEVLKKNILEASNMDELRGMEGDAANVYFGVLNHLMITQKNPFVFSGRNRHPPRDPVNALLSFVYTLLAHECTAALESVGLDPYVGLMHTLRPGRTSLALDLMEELRAYLGDRLVLSLINRKQISSTDFLSQGTDGVVMTDDARKTVLTTWQNRKKELFTHPYLNEKIPIGLLPYVQAKLLSKYIRQDLDDYPVFLIK
ncbi:MAG: type I-C CRISPR-associated endonuclease Cas1c [Bacteroidales bacterium]|nr:type I-C CRISPR-associated endonuclease Cas1c [Bacteroidales bacterium]